MSAPAASCATPLPKRAALYARVSTGEQDSEAQVVALRSYAEGRGWDVALVLRETVTGSGHGPRDEFDRPRSAIQAEPIDVVLVVQLDRPARSVRDAPAFFEEAESHPVRVVVTTQDIDTGTPAGRLTRTILAGVAEFEGELIREQTRAAMAAIKAGTKLTRSGRPPVAPRKPRLRLWRVPGSYGGCIVAGPKSLRRPA